MLILRSAGLAFALTLAAGAALAQESPSPGLRGCMVPAAPLAEQPCHHQLARFGVDGVEAITDIELPVAEPLEIATFDVNGMAVASAVGRMVAPFPDMGAEIASADNATPEVETTGSITPSGPQR